VIVAIDTLFLSQTLRYTGTGTYLRQLLRECLKIAKDELSNFEFHGFRAPHDKWTLNGDTVHALHVHEAKLLQSKRLWLMGGMAFHTAHIGADLVFLPTAQHSLPGPSAPVVTTILDAIPRRVPREMVRSSMRLEAMTWINAKLAARIITISACSKKDLVEICRVDPAKITITYPGYDSNMFNSAAPDAEDSEQLLLRLGIRRPYVLHHGTVQLRKNVQRLVRAWGRVHEGCKSFDAQLVLAGGMGEGWEQILRSRDASAERDQIIVTGPLSDEDMALLVKNASLCVVPSLYEGFCLPMVEAMACGVPTVASNSSCLPEVSGGVLEYFNPNSVEEMAQTIQRALEDSTLRNKLCKRGLARAAEFSWARCARETLRVFAETART
jgi:glycosyltransferase involved in cell wall biosynthesis